MQTKGERLDEMIFTNADERYARKINDLQGGDTTMLMQQVKEAMTVNQELNLKDQSSWIWLMSEQMGFPLRSEFANENHGEAGSSKQCNRRTSVLIKPHFSWRLASQISFETRKGTL